MDNAKHSGVRACMGVRWGEAMYIYFTLKKKKIKKCFKNTKKTTTLIQYRVVKETQSSCSTILLLNCYKICKIQAV